jgi:imidazolonepropionase-like amidohydrolase
MLFRADRLFDGRTPKVFRDWVVEVEDGRILDVGPRSRAASGSDAGDVVDFGDVTPLPALIDAHQHLVFDASDDPVAHLQAEDDAAVLQGMHHAAQRALAVGITTVRDLGDRSYLSLTLRDVFRAGRRVLGAPALGCTCAHRHDADVHADVVGEPHLDRELGPAVWHADRADVTAGHMQGSVWSIE